MAEKPLKYRKVRQRLGKFGVYEDPSFGKGSHRAFCGIVNGVQRKYPIKCHNEGEEKPKAVIGGIRRAFNLTPVNGVSDEMFYGGPLATKKKKKARKGK